MKIENIVIVGGGTAGWLVANHLGKALEHRPEVTVTLVESATIPTIGVGEGTVPAIRQSLAKFGISESEFIRECDATFKQSIKFVNWLDKTQHGENAYHHLFNYPFPFGEDLTPAWLNEAAETAYADAVSVQAGLCEAGRAPKFITTAEYKDVTAYAYHLDAGKFARLLGRNAIERFGVKHQRADIADVLLDDEGNIRVLSGAKGERFQCDLVVDCSGFRCAILGEKLGVNFIDRSDMLLTDKALAVQVPTDADAPIPPYTLATAHQAGWIWDIALPQRRGVGLVYSSAHLSDDAAYQKLDSYLGGKLEGLNPRCIPMPVGRREVFWRNNCVAIGLAQGFVEPLEATAILLADFSADLLSKSIPEDAATLPLLADRFNHRLIHSWEQVLAFVKLHYCISDRQDSAFWRDNRAPDTIPQELRNKLALWRTRAPCREDFFSKFEVFDLENYLYVLYGMKYPTRPPRLGDAERRRAREQVTRLAEIQRHLLDELPPHRALIDKIRQYGLPKF